MDKDFKFTMIALLVFSVCCFLIQVPSMENKIQKLQQENQEMKSAIKAIYNYEMWRDGIL